MYAPGPGSWCDLRHALLLADAKPATWVSALSTRLFAPVLGVSARSNFFGVWPRPAEVRCEQTASSCHRYVSQQHRCFRSSPLPLSAPGHFREPIGALLILCTFFPRPHPTCIQRLHGEVSPWTLSALRSEDVIPPILRAGRTNERDRIVPSQPLLTAKLHALAFEAQIVRSAWWMSMSEKHNRQRLAVHLPTPLPGPCHCL